MPKSYFRLNRIERRLSICRPEERNSVVTMSYFDESPYFADQEERDLFIAWRRYHFTGEEEPTYGSFTLYHYREADVEKHLQTFKTLKGQNLLPGSTASTPAIYLPELNSNSTPP